VIVASGIFATTELGMGPETLVIVILFVQFVAAGGAWLFNLVAARIGAKNTIIINLLIWSASVIYAYGFLYTTTQFWILGFTTGLVLGSSQALSRSLFSQMIPENRESAYFGLYEISERGTSWLGPIVFTYAVNQTDSARIAILPIIAFFVFGMVMLYFTDVREAIRAAGNEVPQVV
jgi:UMF1 family MFS transporter